MQIKPGGKEGGDVHFMAAIGFILAAAGLYFLFDSVRVHSDGGGFFSGMMRGRGGAGGGLGNTTSMGIIFVPFIISVIALFYDASKRWGWYLLGVGLFIIIVELLSRIRFHLDMKTSHLLLIFVLFSAGVGLMIRAFRIDKSAEAERQADGSPSSTTSEKQDPGE